MRHAITAALAVLLGLGGVAAAGTPPPSVDALLDGYEHVPTPAQWARAAGSPEAAAARLMAVAGDHAADSLTRGRALSGLGHLSEVSGVTAFLLARVSDAALSLRLRGKALIAVAFGSRDAVAPQVAALLAHASPRLREDAVRALRLMAAPEVEALLRGRTNDEPVPHLRAALASAADAVAANRAALRASPSAIPSVQLPAIPPPAVAPAGATPTWP